MRSSGIKDETIFLARAYEGGVRFSRMVEEEKGKLVRAGI
jgi:hypothetical protein